MSHQTFRLRPPQTLSDRQVAKDRRDGQQEDAELGEQMGMSFWGELKKHGGVSLWFQF